MQRTERVWEAGSPDVLLGSSRHPTKSAKVTRGKAEETPHGGTVKPNTLDYIELTVAWLL